MKKLVSLFISFFLLTAQAFAALPDQLKTSRMTDATLASTIDNEVGNLEKAAAAILGIPIDTNISNALFTVTASGLTKVIFQDLAGDPAAAGELARNAANLKFHDGTAARTIVLLETAQTLSGIKTFSDTITSTLGTITTDKQNLTATATWNAAGVTFTALKLNATDTASAAGSSLLDLQVGGVSKFKVPKTGIIAASSGATGIDTSGSTGVPKIAAGTWSIDAQVATARGGLGADFSATAQGNIFYFSGAGVVSALVPGTKDQSLRTGGSAANPSWGNSRICVAKSADETVNNSSTFQDDDHVFYPMAANTSYQFEVWLLWSATSGAPDFKAQWTFPAGATMFWDTASSSANVPSAWAAVALGGTANALLTEASTFAWGSSNVTGGQAFWLIVRNGANAGNLQLQWAQNTANASDSKILKDSILCVTRIQ